MCSLESDIETTHQALSHFCNSQFTTAASLLTANTLYPTHGRATLAVLKALMTFVTEDLSDASGALSATLSIASEDCKDKSWFSLWNNYPHQMYSSMTRLQRHAELIRAEAQLLDAVLSIFYNDGWTGFLKQAISVRASYATYQAMAVYVEGIDGKLEEMNYDACQDKEFVAGVALGVGVFELVFSMMPKKVAKLCEWIGYGGKRDRGLRILGQVGGWNSGEEMCGGKEGELQPGGMRRTLCDLTLLSYHAVIGALVEAKVDLVLAEKLLLYSQSYFPKGFLCYFFAGRLCMAQRGLIKALDNYEKAISVQNEWKQFHHVCFWDMMWCCAGQSEFGRAEKYAAVLLKESKWSPCIFQYLKNVFSYIKEGSKNADRLSLEMRKVDGLKRKVVGRSIPMEKFVIRKARKFILQEDRLELPEFELIFVFHVFKTMATKELQVVLDKVEATLNRMQVQVNESDKYATYYDDFCLCLLIKGSVFKELYEIEQDKKYLERSENALLQLIENGNSIVLDHWMYPFARYVLAKVFIFQKRKEDARKELEQALTVQFKRYSLESQLHFKIHNTLQRLDVLI